MIIIKLVALNFVAPMNLLGCFYETPRKRQAFGLVYGLHLISECLGPSPGSTADSSFLPVHTLGDGQGWLKQLSPWNPCWRPELDSWHLASAWPSYDFWGHLGNELTDGRILSLFVCLCASQIDKIKNIKLLKKTPIISYPWLICSKTPADAWNHRWHWTIYILGFFPLHAYMIPINL